MIAVLAVIAVLATIGIVGYMIVCCGHYTDEERALDDEEQITQLEFDDD